MSDSYGAMINSCGSLAGQVDDKICEMQANADDPKALLENSLELMQLQQRMTTMTESFTKAMKANTDAQKAAITSMA
jgi:hypothetical protein